MRKLAELSIVLLAIGLFFLGRAEGKRAADKWWNAKYLPVVIKVEAPRAPNLYPVICKDSAVCFGEQVQFGPGWFVCGININASARVVYGVPSSCTVEAQKRIEKTQP